MRRLFFLAFIGLVFTFPAQSQDAATLSLERLFASGEFFGDRYGPARWMEDGSGYTTIERSDGGGTDIVLYEPASGDRSVLVSSASLTPSGSARPLDVADYVWSADGSKLLIFTNTARVWRDNTRGDYWVLDRASGRLQQLGIGARPSSLMFAKFSPDGSRVGYVRENNVYVETLSDGSIRQLTDDGSRTTINGTSDWVYEEEFGLRDCFRWSPDGRHVAYWQFDATGVGEFLMINNTDSIYSYTIPLQYPKAGTTNSSVRIGVVPAEGGETVWVEDDDDPRNHYLARMDWADNNQELIIQHLNRLQNTNEVRIVSAETGQRRTVMTDRDDAWLEVVDDLIWIDGGTRFTWLSERDGWAHVFLVDRLSGALQTVTEGEYDVLSISRIDPVGGWIYFIGSLDTATERYLYRVPLTGGAAPERLTPEGDRGWHDYQVSHDGKWAIHSVSTFGAPGMIELVSLPDHAVRRTLVDNMRLKATVGALTLGESSFFQLTTADDVTLDGWMIKPSHFDPNLKYPVFFHVYGEPAGQTVVNRWGGSRMLWHYMLAEQGYVVISIDNRGTPGPHGRAWRKMIYGEIGTIASQDQAAALDEIAKWPFIDTSRVGIWGWSGGGSMTLNMLFRHPDKYHVGMSVAPVPDQRLYDTIYQERYMGLPQLNEAGFRDGSPITHAEGLKGKLLVVHGSGDDNVHYQGTELLVNRLIELNKPFEMMVYPNRSHGIYEGQGTRLHLYGLLTRYLTDNLVPGGMDATGAMVQPKPARAPRGW